ncbi:MAG: NTP transferase domain-containing protein [Methanomicrobiaceae archaeon]|nr:NTP transferase domain-containing protein [Methanomicrobiaceae archaeon]
MAGGIGSRLEMGEKPLVTVSGRPMLQYVADAFTGAGHEVLVVVSDRVPMTKNWCRVRGYDIFNASGAGYVEDMIECIKELQIIDPFFFCVSDLPALSSEIIREVTDKYKSSGKPALSVWTPEDYYLNAGCVPSYVEIVDGCRACPAGLNILDASLIDSVQDEFRLLLRRPELAFNVNCKKDLGSFLNFIDRE